MDSRLAISEAAPVSALYRVLAFAALLLVTSALALAQEAVTLRDLQPKAAAPLSRAELLELLPGARMTRVNDKGSTHVWANDPGGEMIVSSDNRGRAGRSSTAQGKWQISDDGRYCMQVQWRKGDPEDWCRFIFETSDRYFAVNALAPDTQKAHKIDMTR